MSKRRRGATRSKTFRLLALIAGVALVAAGCGNSDASGNSGSDGSGGNSDVAAASKALAAATTFPDKIPVTTPLDTAPEKGGEVVHLVCDDPNCDEHEKGLEAAAKAVGWTVRPLTYKNGDPSTLTAALTQALQFHPKAVLLEGSPQDLWASVLPQYEKAGVPIVTMSVGDVAHSRAIIANVSDLSYWRRHGEALGNWFVNKSGGSGKVLLVSLPVFALNVAISDGFTSAVEKSCPDCSIEKLDVTLPQLQSLAVPSAIVSKLRQNPDIKYVASTQGVFVDGLSSQLGAAGISGLSIGSTVGTVQTQAAVRAGQVSAVTGQGIGIETWLAMDSVLRHDQGLPVDSAAGAGPFVPLLTKDNMSEPSFSVDEPQDYQRQFEALWKVGG